MRTRFPRSTRSPRREHVPHPRRVLAEVRVARRPTCHLRKQRSGCGIIARWRPSAEQRAAMPSGEPLGLCGYASVIVLASST
eukprot:901766-Prymnesium_polylepis.1